MASGQVAGLTGLATVGGMELLWFMLAAAALAGAVPMWRLPLKLPFKILGTVCLLTAAAGFVFAGFCAAAFTHDPGALATTAILLLGGCTVVLGGALYFLGRSWLADRADISRLRDTAQRNADQISVVSHEIRTPLALMKGAADLLAEGTPGPLTRPQEKFVNIISGNCSSVINLAEELLIQARIDAGIFRLQLQWVNFRSLATVVVKELRLLHPVDIALDCPGAPSRAWADAGLLRQALTNLINNAVANAHQATLVTVRIVNADEQILVSVSDDGIGMTPNDRKQLFERFASGRPLRDGTGLGLVITRQIIQMHGGDVFVDSTPQRGTTMLFSIPTGEAAKAAILPLHSEIST